MLSLKFPDKKQLKRNWIDFTWTIGVPPRQWSDFSPHHLVHIGFTAHAASYPLGTTTSVVWGKAAVA
jgi:hypothetical protein